jgi:hypothetical protein
MEMQPVDFGSCRAFIRQVFDQTNGEFVLNSLAIRFSGRAEEQDPCFTFRPHFLF